ncbi:hypothetical protein PENDEC_c009G00723 [Penicillium decumbens]|uniref:Fungal-type protein kinase domain-containing protein n=1 Tax=Penicillium decumbens TaxID=69771 RepID=A0A1V6PCP4_PENDC|nr:hypothetical protein PENDEC_c009G00723 [Penicillium decumbens]
MEDDDNNRRIWFQNGPYSGNRITLGPFQWEIVQKLNEHSTQRNQAEHDHYRGTSGASTKLLCRDHRDYAYMRIVQQIPILNTETTPAVKGSEQAATRYTLEELDAYQKLTQRGSTNTPKLLAYKVLQQDASSVLVPNGYLIYLVWELVPGLRLGAKQGPDPFWDLDRVERDEIRSAFIVGLKALLKIGIISDGAALSSLVWHKESKTVRTWQLSRLLAWKR